MSAPIYALLGLFALPLFAVADVEEPALLAPPINLAPGAEYADSARMFQGIPTLECTANGRLWTAWYGGGMGEDRLNYVMPATAIASRASTDSHSAGSLRRARRSSSVHDEVVALTLEVRRGSVRI